MTTAREIMTPDATCIGADDNILDAAKRQRSTSEGHAHRPRHRDAA
ncbi:hypothetical protein ACXNSR_02710 [Streptomyces sp. NC-S4]